MTTSDELKTLPFPSFDYSKDIGKLFYLNSNYYVEAYVTIFLLGDDNRITRRLNEKELKNSLFFYLGEKNVLMKSLDGFENYYKGHAFITNKNICWSLESTFSPAFIEATK